jgi:hypothetical protein
MIKDLESNKTLKGFEEVIVKNFSDSLSVEFKGWIMNKLHKEKIQEELKFFDTSQGSD